ncbi:hypothetical protein ES708_04298 [subsurface metagenome]
MANPINTGNSVAISPAPAKTPPTTTFKYGISLPNSSYSFSISLACVPAAATPKGAIWVTLVIISANGFAAAIPVTTGIPAPIATAPTTWGTACTPVPINFFNQSLLSACSRLSIAIFSESFTILVNISVVFIL